MGMKDKPLVPVLHSTAGRAHKNQLIPFLSDIVPLSFSLPLLFSLPLSLSLAHQLSNFLSLFVCLSLALLLVLLQYADS